MDDVLIDRLRTGLADAADGIDVGDAGTDLPATHRSAHRRRRRNIMLSGLFGVALVGAGLAIVNAVVDGEADSIRTITPPTTVADDDTDEGGDESPNTTAPVTSTTVEGTATDPEEGATEVDGGNVSRIVGTSRSATAQSVAAPAVASEPTGDRFLLPWQDGFLVGSIEGVTPTTELSDELFALFPQEIQDLFPDGVGEPTVEQSAAIIAEAELTLQVMDVLSRNPELEAAVYSQPAYSVVTAEYSVDGDAWEPIVIEVPPEVALVEDIATVGDRLVVIGTPATVRDTFPASGGIASTTDLVRWTVHTIPIDLPTDLPGGFETLGGDVQAVLTETGWVAAVETHLDLDIESLLPDEVVESAGGYGTSPGTDGVTVTVYGDEGETLTEVVLTWDELGIDETTFRQLMGGPDAAVLHTATWEGEVAPVDQRIVDIRPLADGYLGRVWDDANGFFGERFSVDGRTWGPVPEPLERKFLATTFSVDDATIVVTVDHAADLHIYRVTDVTGPWEEIEVDGLPPAMDAGTFTDTFHGAALRGGAVVDGADPFINEYESTVEAAGLRLDITQARRSADYRVVDTATSEELAAETVELREVDEPWNPFTDLATDHETDTITITDPESGDLIATFPAATVIDDRGRAEHEYITTRHERRDGWLVATADGVDWIVVDLDDVDDEFGDPSSRVAVNGTTALVDAPTGWLRYDL